MNWNKTEDTGDTRKYLNKKTGTECVTRLLYTDKFGHRWFGFEDLFKIPYMRIAYAKQIADLFTTGLTSEDLKGWCQKEKDLLKSNDPEKYEKLYSMILDKEALINNTVDPLQQHLSLCAVYVMNEEERIDTFDMKTAADNMKLWQLDGDAVGFFLNWHIGHIHNLTSSYNNISRIALKANQPGKEQEFQP